MLATTWLRHACPGEFRADAGAFDLPAVKTDARGRVLGKDGRPLGTLVDGHPVTRQELRQLLREAEADIQAGRKPRIGRLEKTEPATVLDDYDTMDCLSHLRALVLDWADACRAAARLLRAPEGHQDALPWKKPKRSTKRGEGQAKLIAALTKHHQYADGECLTLQRGL